MQRINGAFAKILAPAAGQQPALQLALPGPPAANPAHIAGAIQYQPRQDAPPAPGEQYPQARGQMNMIQKGRPSNRCQKLITRQVYQAVTMPPAAPEYLKGSETSITFSREDHPPRVPRPGHAALVLDAQIGLHMTKVFMDGGSGINIIFADTLRKMGRSLEGLAKFDSTFHGIVPEKAVYPEGSITLDMVFGTPAHFRKESIDFEVVEWPSQYHAILGRPTFARLMAVPHYAYLMLKMPGPKGVITVRGDFERSDKCDRDFSKISESFGMQQQLEELSRSNDKTIFPTSKKPATDAAFSTNNDTRAHQVHPTDASKTVLVSSSLPPK